MSNGLRRSNILSLITVITVLFVVSMIACSNEKSSTPQSDNAQIQKVDPVKTDAEKAAEEKAKADQLEKTRLRMQGGVTKGLEKTTEPTAVPK